MRKIIVTANISLDGVMQGMGNPNEDPSGNFKYGGWAVPLSDETTAEIAQKEMQEQVDYLLGRKTFEIFTRYWRDHANVWPGIHEGTKFILSRTMKYSDPMTTGWKNVVFVEDIEEIKKVKSSNGPDIQIWGSGELIHLLLQNGLVDELRFRIFPVVLGEGKRIFNSQSMAKAFSLKESTITQKGVIVAIYKLDGEVKTGSFGY